MASKNLNLIVKNSANAKVYNMKKIVIPEGSLVVELDEESFWRLVAVAEEKIAFETKDSIYYFNSSEVIFYFLKTNSGCEVKF